MRLLTFEWAALAFLAISLAFGAMVGPNPFLGFIAVLVWGFLAFGLTIGGLINAWREPLSAAQRIRSAVAMPAAMAILLLTSFV